MGSMADSITYVLSKKVKVEKISTKKCPKCGNEELSKLRSLNKKICTDCEIEIPWFLEEDQKSLL